MVFANKATDDKPPGWYYLIYLKEETYSEDMWEPVKIICHLRRKLKNYHVENLDKPIAISPPVN